MWSRPPFAAPRRPLTLAGQFLVLQLAVLTAVLAVTSVVSLRQSDQDFRDTRGARLQAAAESLASTPAVQNGLEQPGDRLPLAFYAQQRADDVGASAVYVTDVEGRVVVGTEPSQQGTVIDLGPGTVLQRRSWTGEILDRGRAAIAAEVPILSDGADAGGADAGGADAGGADAGAPDADVPPAGTLVGIAIVTEDFPPLTERLRRTADDFAVFLLFGLALGVLGSWLLARLIKRRTRGLEPAEIAALADQREVLLTSLREGLVAVAADGTLTVVSDSARELLGLPADAQGRRLDDLPLTARVRDLLGGDDPVRDAVLVVSGRVVVVNRNPVEHGGTVTTLRDRTELLAMQSELNARESVTETLRAQTHEFSNQLHTISGLVQLEEYDEVGRLIGTLTRRRAEISDFITARLEDPAVAALLIAKTSLAAERRIELALSLDSALPRLDPDASADVGTVLGNLVDNAVDAVAAPGGRVDVRLRIEDDAGTVVVQVADSGPGVPADRVEEIFRRGFSTKPSDASGRGVGLALVQIVCERRGGSVSVRNDVGAAFTARLPLTAVPERAS